MLGSQPSATPAKSQAATDRLELSIRELLDHTAVELAHEYVRLMETAAEAEVAREEGRHGKELMTVAIYARYSSENQRPESIDDQVSACRRAAKARGLAISDDHI